MGGLVPSPLHFISLSQVGLNRWARAIAMLVGPPLFIDGVLLVLTLLFYRYIPMNVAHGVAYVGGAFLVAFATYSILQAGRRTHEEIAQSSALTYTGVSIAALSEVTAPGTWVYWLTVAGPILGEGKKLGYLHVVPFFAGGLIGYYGAALISVWVLAWGASLHKQFKPRLFVASNYLLLIMGLSYLVRAYFVR